MLINSGSNYFYLYDNHINYFTELAISTEIGISPTLQKLNEEYIIAIGGKYSDTVNIYEIKSDKWYYIGRLSSHRFGAYAVMNDYDNIVYIAGGVNDKEDNTLDIEYFRINKSFDCEIMIKKFKDHYLLRKVNPIIIPIFDFNTYLICGGSGLFGDVNTCAIYYTDRDTVILSNNTLPKALSTESHNMCFYKNSVYFFSKFDEVIKYDGLENSYSIISNNIY